MKKKKTSIFLIILSLMVICINTTVFALTINNAGYYKYPVDLDYDALSQPYYGRMYNAAYYWNQKSGKNYVTYSSTSGNLAVLSYDPDNTYGEYTIQAVGGTTNHQTTKFYLYLNTRLLDGASDTYKESTSSHELGHALGLSDCTTGTTIMNSNRDRNKISSPQTDDIAAAAQNYSR